MYSKREYIDAIKWHFDVPTGKAEKIYNDSLKSGNVEFLDLLVEGFKGNARKVFYED